MSREETQSNFPFRPWRSLAAAVALAVIAGCDAAYEAQSTVKVRSGDTPDAVEVQASAPASPSSESASDRSPVAAKMRLSKSRVQPGDVFEVRMTLRIAPPWEVAALGSATGRAGTQLELKLPEGMRAQGDWQTPEPVRSMMPDGHPVYAGEAVFTRSIVVEESAAAGDYSVQCEMRYQACDERQCLREEKVVVRVPLVVE